MANSMRLVVLTGGCLIVYKVKSTQAFQIRKKAYPLFGAYVRELAPRALRTASLSR
jgi:hypothetical protein